MRAILLPALTLSTVASVAVAEPVKLTGSTPPSAGSPSGAVASMSFASDGEREPLHLTASQVDAVARALVGFGAEAEPPRATNDGPVRLSAAQMDAITAGLVAVNVTALAVARGADAFTGTDTRADATGSEWIEVAYGVGEAYAVGDDAAVDVATSVYGDGDYVTGGSLRFVVNGPGYALGRTMGFVIVIDADHPRFESLQRKFEGLANHLDRGYEAQADQLQRVSEHWAAHGDRGDERLAGYLERGYEHLIGFVERGYGHFVRSANCCGAAPKSSLRPRK